MSSKAKNIQMIRRDDEGNIIKPELSKRVDPTGVIENRDEVAFIPSKYPMIKFGGEFDDWTDEKKIDYLMKFSSSMNEAARILFDEKLDLFEKMIQLEKMNANADQQISQLKAIMIKNITDSNAQKEKYVKDIADLQYRVKTQNKVIQELNEKLGD